MNLVSGAAEKLTQNVMYSTVCGLVLMATFLHFKKKYNYWSKLGIKGEFPMPLFGETWTLMNNDPLELQRNRTKKFGRIYGVYLFGEPVIVIADPEVIRQILVKDFDAFTDHGINGFKNKYEKHFLVWIKGDVWKKTRTLMTPTFTSGKIKRMYMLIDGCADDLIELIQEDLEKSKASGSILNIKKVFSYFTMDGITTCCYGMKLKRASTLKNSAETGIATRDDFLNIIAKTRPSKARILAFQTIPKILLTIFGFELNSSSSVEPLIQRIEKMIELRRNSPKKTDDFLQSIIDARLGDMIELNEMDLKENHHAGLTQESLLNDHQKMIQDLKADNENKVAAEGKFGLSDHEIKAEALLMLIAGYETTSILLTDCAYCLAFHQEVQERLFGEVEKIAEFNPDDGSYHFAYETLTSCLYVDAVISETLRLFSPAYSTDRLALRDYFIEKYNVVVPKGNRVILAFHSVQNDPEYWEDPLKYNPDRFMPGNKEKIVPGTYLPFSSGPRHCIGMRFSLTEAKLGLAKTIMKFKFEPAPGLAFPPEIARDPGLVKIANPILRVIPRN